MRCLSETYFKENICVWEDGVKKTVKHYFFKKIYFYMKTIYLWCALIKNFTSLSQIYLFQSKNFHLAEISD